jgi:hypothetical protein
MTYSSIESNEIIYIHIIQKKNPYLTTLNLKQTNIKLI